MNLSVPRELLERMIARWRLPSNCSAFSVEVSEYLNGRDAGYTSCAEELEDLLSQPEAVGDDDPFMVNWDDLERYYSYVAMDKNGKWFAYPSEPFKRGTVWDSRWSPVAVGGLVIVKLGTDWRTTLRKRPEAK